MRLGKITLWEGAFVIYTLREMLLGWWYQRG